MFKRILLTIGVSAIAGFAVFMFLSSPQPVDQSALPVHAADVGNGRLYYHIGGCISCHMPPKDAAGRDPLLPSGGKEMVTPIGRLYPPNITPDRATGIGAWSDVDFVNAVQHGIAPDGSHYIPAFPYKSYARMRTEDVLDIKAYLMTLPAVVAETPDNDLPFPWLMRRGIGVWKLLGPTSPIAVDPAQSPAWNRGAYLVNGAGHCAECHTPRNIFMVMDESRAFTGGPHPEGKGKVPSLRNLISNGYYIDANDIAAAFREGEDGGYDGISRRGMGEVRNNISMLPDEDIRAIAEYLTSLK
jgi:mono/diheme cytochrome c family protein